MRRRAVACCSLFVAATSLAQGQAGDSLSGFDRFFTPASEPDRARTIGVGATIGGLYGGASVALYNFWYRDFPLGRFHAFNDNAEWLQMDKVGHGLNAYFQTTWSYGLFHWAGQPEGKAVGYAALTSTTIQLTIEVFDGFSEQWGFSWGDLLANAAGTSLAVGQQVGWGEQRVSVKFGFHPVDYPADLEERALDLYGHSFSEKLLKDYNGLTYWLSVSPGTFIRGDSRFPEWLAVSVGYGAEGLYGGFANAWCSNGAFKPEDCPDGMLIDRSDVPRQRQLFLSVDVDFTKIETNKPWLRTLFGIVNVIKVPAPALEWREGDGFLGHWIYF